MYLLVSHSNLVGAGFLLETFWHARAGAQRWGEKFIVLTQMFMALKIDWGCYPKSRYSMYQVEGSHTLTENVV